jgi:pimeloyl-ACP methyl ester carboxylesterase
LEESPPRISISSAVPVDSDGILDGEPGLRVVPNEQTALAVDITPDADIVGGVAVAPGALAFEPSLNFYECPADAQPAGVQCASLTVPLDWQTPDDGRTTEIALRVIRAPKNNRGGFTFNPGGPGGAGIEIGAIIHSELPPQVRSRFDFVMWDPRGVGLSGPQLSGCDAPSQPNLPDTGPVDWQSEWAEFSVQYGQANQACFEANPDAAPYLGTWQVVRDLDAMRAALGYPRWNYWGMSYGTRIGYTFAKTFPNRLRTMIVDGSLWPQESVYRLASQQPAGWITAQQVYASVVGRAQARKINQILEALNDRVIVDTSSGVRLTRWSVSSSIYGSLGNQSLYPQIRQIVNILHDELFATGGPRNRTRIATLLAALDAEVDSQAKAYVFGFVNCADLQDRPTPEAMGRLAAATERNYGTTLPIATMAGTTCMGLPTNYSPGVPRELTTISLATPPMVVLSSGDRATPWIWGRTMANQYAGSRTITYESSQHVTYLQTSSMCVNQPVTRYLITRQMPRTDIFCAYVPS